MSDLAASVLAKLKNKAKASGISYQRCLQLFFQEEFLRRLAASKYAENFVLKGGLFIYTLTNFESRATVDVDFLMRGLSNDLARMDEIIAAILAVPTGNDFVTFKTSKAEPIALQRK
ncbi:MAG: nucleotidyl transferase AbiEii/AbiGii toxin family protein, partial [Clostridiales bacterium]|nr:nucleotidyl transferase AbiEii/AbiGii toxin family protein [Clostridiales bacterium]